MKIHLNSESKRKEAFEALINLDTNGEYEITLKKLPKTRTSQQRKAIEVYCKKLGQAWNDAGMTVQQVLSRTMDQEWSQELVKEAIFKKCLGYKYNKKSTTELTTDEVSQVYETVNRFSAQFGVHVPWPQDETKTR